MASDSDHDQDQNQTTDQDTATAEPVAQVKKQSKPGIIYLSILPPKMNVTQIRDYFSQFGELHRSYLQPQEDQKKRKNRVYTEGWIEFKKRRHAKRVAKLLNNTPLGGKKKHQNYDFLWNIKYLHGLQWAHINERLAYERISKQQKIRAEIAAAKRETSFFAHSVSLNKKLKRKFKEPFTEVSEDPVDTTESGDAGAEVPNSGSGSDVGSKPVLTDLTSKRVKLYKSLFADS